MNFCGKCGAQLEGDNIFCPNCGAKVETVGAVANGPPSVEVSTSVVQHPMKWFKFLIYFALFAGAVINLVYGFNWISGDIYFVQTNG